MKSKSFLIKAAATALVLTAGAVTAETHAQTSVGYWNIYPQYSSSSVSNVVDTGSKMFYLTMGKLHSFDTVTQESYSYNSNNKLNDNNITKIFHFPQINSILIAYDNGNLDLLDIKNDHVSNMGDIADANLNYEKTINDAFYHKGSIYVATSFGIVVFDAARHYVTESGIYGQSINTVFASRDKLYIIVKDENTMRWSPIAERHNKIDKFEIFNQWSAATSTVPFGEAIVQISDNGIVNAYKNRANSDYDFDLTITDFKPVQPLIPNADGTVTVVTDSDIITLSPDADPQDNYVSSRMAIPSAIKGTSIGTPDSGNTIWSFANTGISRYSVGADGSLTVLVDKIKPEATSVSPIYLMAGSKGGENLYMTMVGLSGKRPSGGGGYIDPLNVNRLASDNSLHEIYPTDENGKNLCYASNRIVVDPKNPNRLFVASMWSGLVVINNDEVEHVFTTANAPFILWWDNMGTKGGNVQDVFFDREGNLWVGCNTVNTQSNISVYNMLPARFVNGDLSAVTKEDWQPAPDRGKYNPAWDMSSVYSSKGDKMISFSDKWQGAMYVYDMKGTPGNTADDDFYTLSAISDQDNKSFKPTYWVCGVEEQRGRLWVGTTSGVVEVTDPRTLGSADFRITRIKVPRNDGTNYADYLLESDRVNCIAVDPSNRKWIATEASGVYLVSENGDKIIEHFTAENSPLPTNAVYSVYCNPSNNMVYFGTGQGLLSYTSSAAPAAEDYSDVYAYPNPVRPDFSGWITVKGLKDNSLVKIADAAGNVFFQTRSEGGMIVWDGCRPDGQRVPSGVYFVFASTGGENENKDGAVTKIMIIR